MRANFFDSLKVQRGIMINFIVYKRDAKIDETNLAQEIFGMKQLY